MDQHPTPLQNPHRPGWKSVQVQHVVPLPSMYNRSSGSDRETVWLQIQQSVHPTAFSAIQGGRPGDRSSQWSTQLSIPSGHLVFVSLTNPLWTHYILQLVSIRTWISKDKSTIQYHHPPNVRSCIRPQGVSPDKPYKTTPNRHIHWCQSDGNIC